VIGGAVRRVPLRVSLHVVVALVAASLALIAQQTGALSGPERVTVDARFGIRGAQPPDERVAIVGLDQKSLKAFDAQIPIPRAKYAQLLDRLRAAAPRLIAIDGQFTGKARDEGGDRALVASIARNGPVLLATHDTRHGPIPVPAGRRQARGAVLASVGLQNDPDNVMRRMLFAPVALKTFAVRAAELYTGHKVSEREFPDNSAWIAFRGPPGTFPTYSFVDVLDGKVARSDLAGKAILVGVTDPSGKDVFVTSASDKPMAGAEVNANALATILDGFPLQPTGGMLTVLMLLALASIPAAVSARFGALPMLLASLGIFFLLLMGVQLAFDSGWIVPVLIPVLGLALSALGSTGVDAFVERRQARALQAALGRLLPPPSPRAFFISYRRDQSSWPARILRDELARRFGSTSVFMDTASLEAGQEWPRRIEDAIRGCSVMLVLIGPSWLDARSAGEARRIDDPRDWVRREIEAVLRRPDAAVVPVLLDGAEMPAADVLPESLRPLTDHQAVALTADRLSSEIDELIDSIEQGRIRDYASRAQHDPDLPDEADRGTPGRRHEAGDERSAGRSTARAPSSSRAKDSSSRTNAGRSS
jgi:CHASE2 domain-containing sensor protein